MALMLGKKGDFHIPGASRHLPPDKEFHAEHIAIHLKVDLEKRQISGACKTRLLPLREGITALHLDAREMGIMGVTLDGVRVPFEHDGSVLTVSPPGPLATATHELKVDYSAEPRQGVYFITPDEKIPDKPVQAWSQGEPEFSRYWYPCHDHPNDKATSEMVITVPDGYLVVSNGRLVSKEKAGGWTTFHWKEDVPHSMYLNSFVAGKFGVIEDVAEGVPLQYYFPESKREDALRLFGLTPDMLKVFESLTRNKYPFEKYSQVAVHDFLIGGMENVSATTLTDTRFPDERSEEDYAARYSRPDRNHVELVAHELAHMWFGDLVTAKHWSHLWLNEGFATYFQALYTREKFGEDEFRHDMHSKAETYFEEDESMYRRAIVDDVYVHPDDVFDSYAYDKAAWMIHQLRYILGDDLFFDATSEYLKRFAGANADTHDYMKVMEEKSGLSLEGYFDQAFFKAGHPEFEVAYSWDEGSHTAEVSVKQTQQTDELTPVFSLPCDIVFYVPSAAGAAKNGGRHVKRVRLGSKEERFHFELPWKPGIVEFDPEERLLKKVKFDKPVAMLLSQLEVSVDASSRRRAAEGLSAFGGSAEVVQALERAVRREDQHFSVRSEAAKSLGKVGTKDALEALIGLSGLSNRRVRRAVVAALGEFKDGRVAKPLLNALRGDESPYVQCQAAVSYGKARLPDAFDVITSAVGTPSPENAITEACLEALGYVKDARTREFLRRHLPYGTPTRVRVGALKGLSRLGWLEEVDVAALRDLLLEDKEYTIRAQVLEVTSELLDRRLLAAVREASEKDADPRARRRAMEVALRLADASSVEKALSDVREDVERARMEGREFRERFSSMKLS
jgi:aminopeptidase N